MLRQAHLVHPNLAAYLMCPQGDFSEDGWPRVSSVYEAIGLGGAILDADTQSLVLSTLTKLPGLKPKLPGLKPKTTLVLQIASCY